MAKFTEPLLYRKAKKEAKHIQLESTKPYSLEMMKFISPPEEVSFKDQPEPETPPKSHQKTLSPKNPWTVRKSFQRLFGDTMSEEVEGRETVLGVSRCVIVGVIGRINCDPYYHNGNRTEILSYRCLDAD